MISLKPTSNSIGCLKCPRFVIRRPTTHHPTITSVHPDRRRNYTSFDLKRIHWDRVVAENRAKVTTTTSPTQLFDILEAMIKPIGDSHAGIEAPQLKRQFEGSPGTDRLLYAEPRKNFRKGACAGCWRLPTGNGSKGPFVNSVTTRFSTVTSTTPSDISEYCPSAAPEAARPIRTWHSRHAASGADVQLCSTQLVIHTVARRHAPKFEVAGKDFGGAVVRRRRINGYDHSDEAFRKRAPGNVILVQRVTRCPRRLANQFS